MIKKALMSYILAQALGFNGIIRRKFLFHLVQLKMSI